MRTLATLCAVGHFDSRACAPQASSINTTSSLIDKVLNDMALACYRKDTGCSAAW